jgi:ubiquitin thioesterase CYLD
MDTDSTILTEDRVFFILMKERLAQRKVKQSLLSKNRDNEEVTALCGSLWYMKSRDFDGMSHGKTGHHAIFDSAEQTDLSIIVDKLQDIVKLSFDEYNLLLAVTSCKDRAAAYQANEGRTLREACQLYHQWCTTKDQILQVDVIDEKGFQEQLTGTLVYAGPVPTHQGYWFAVELLSVYNGNLLVTDGVFLGQQLFSCHMDRTVLVAVNKIHVSVQSPFGVPQLSIGDQILWISPTDSHELGKVRWIGVLLDASTSEYIVGVEFDNAIGTGTGTYKGRTLFCTRPKHASFIPISGLIKAVDFYGDEALVPGLPASAKESPENVLPSSGQVSGQTLAQKILIRQQEEAWRQCHALPRADEPHQHNADRNQFLSHSASIGDETLTNNRRHACDVSDVCKDDDVESSAMDCVKSEQLPSTMSGVVDTNMQSSSVDHSEVETQDDIVSVAPNELGTDLELGSVVEVDDCEQHQYGVIRWMGISRDTPYVGVEMEQETSEGTDGTFRNKHLFTCAAKHALFVQLNRVHRDTRFVESAYLVQRTDSHAFGSIDCPDVPGNLLPVSFTCVTDVARILGINKGIQGHQNSCYIDATLFSMFAFSMAFDSLLYRPRQPGDIKQYDQIQKVLREGIVNPLRSEAMFVRADKVMELRKLLNECSSVEGLVNEEKDPEEFLNSLLQQTLKVDSFLKLSTGQECYFYQLFLEKDELVSLPTTQHLLGLSFYQGDLKFMEVPSCLILQMPRFGKDFKMYRRIVPSLTLDITDLLLSNPRPCFGCGHVAALECKDCYNDATGGGGTEKQFFCRDCHATYHKNPKRANHAMPQPVPDNKEFLKYVEESGVLDQDVMPRETMDLFAVICIGTSHYVAFVRCGTSPESPWIFFDSMADRIGQTHGYNVPRVELCRELPMFLLPENQAEILKIGSDMELSEQMRRLLCDGYICMYQSAGLINYR